MPPRKAVAMSGMGTSEAPLSAELESSLLDVAVGSAIRAPSVFDIVQHLRRARHPERCLIPSQFLSHC